MSDDTRHKLARHVCIALGELVGFLLGWSSHKGGFSLWQGLAAMTFGIVAGFGPGWIMRWYRGRQ